MLPQVETRALSYATRSHDGAAMESLPTLVRPTRLDRIYDVVKEAGIDVAPWHEGKGDYLTNPKFCYRWAFEGESVVLLSLWFRTFTEVDGIWTCSGNARRDQMEREAQGSDHWDSAVRNRTKRWAMSAYQMDEVMKQAFRKKLPVRVCVVDSKDTHTSELEASTADYRALDPVPWGLTYDMLTGDFKVVRGAVTGAATSGNTEQAEPIPVETEHAIETETGVLVTLPEITDHSYGVGVVDQFIDNTYRDPVLVEKWERERSAKVRQMVMLRSQGRCEWCGKPGFLKHDGQIYLESHHIVPLSLEGPDHITNVIALCPNDHRMAHYGENRETMALDMSSRIRDLVSQTVP